MIGYERIGQLVAVSATLKTSVDLSVANKEMSVDFLNYVKSQVHLNISDDLYHRPFREYVDAFRFLTKGYEMYQHSAEKVLRYFYSDMAGFLIRNPTNVELKISIGDELPLPITKFGIDSVKQELRKLASVDSVEALESSQYPEILDVVKSKEDLLVKLDSYAVAAVLGRAARQKELSIVIFDDEEVKD